MAEMVRQKQQVNDPAEIRAILDHAQVLRLAMSRDDQPYLVPLCFGYADGVIYLHTGRRGQKIDFLRANPRVCFEVESEVAVVPGDQPCAWNFHYRSVVGMGTATVVSDAGERRRGLQVIAEHYAGPGQHRLLPDSADRATVIRIDITEMTGRRSSG